MIRLERTVLALVVSFAAMSPVAAPPSSATMEIPSYLRGEAQIRLQEGASIEAVNARFGTQLQDSLPPLYLLRLPGSGDEEQWVERLQADPDVVSAECSWRTETPEGVRQMVVILVGGTIDGYLDQGALHRCRIPSVWETWRGLGVRIAVLDTGIRSDHEALAGAVEPGGWDFVSNDADPSEEALGLDEDGDGLIDEGYGHGTMVAGILHLLAPDARLIPLRVLDDEGAGRVFDVARAIRYAVDGGAQIVNLSLGLLQHASAIQEQILYANAHGVVVVAAAGNLAMENPAYYPALDPQVLSVAALDSCDVKAGFSNWHRSVDLSAPGVGILAPHADGGYALGAGTSFAVPFIAAQCAWIREAAPSADLGEVYRIARGGATDIYSIDANQPYRNELGSGRIDGERTLASILEETGPCAVPDAWAPVSLSVRPNPWCEGEDLLITVLRRSDGPYGGIGVYDLAGRRVARIALPQSASAGGLELRWSAAEAAGLSAGVYLLRFEGDRGGAARVIRLRE